MVDSVDRELDTWLASMSIDDDRGARVEAARQRIGRLSRLFTSVLDDVAAGHRLTVGDWAALSVIERADGPCTPTALAQALTLTSGTISTRLGRLRAAGLVETAGADDGRSRPVRLTPDGHARWAAATADRVSIERGLFDEALDDRSLDALNPLLATLLARFEQRYGPAPRHDRTA